MDNKISYECVISRQDAIDYINKELKFNLSEDLAKTESGRYFMIGYDTAKKSMCDYLYFLPKKVIVHSVWILDNETADPSSARNYHCLACGYKPLELGKFCSECGAIMDKYE